MEYKEMCIIMYPYTCPSCGNNMLFFTRAKNNMVIDYKNLIESEMNNNDIMDYLSNKDVEYLKCIACKRKYIIDWSRNYARPLIDKNALKQFGYKFKE